MNVNCNIPPGQFSSNEIEIKQNTNIRFNCKIIYIYNFVYELSELNAVVGFDSINLFTKTTQDL